MVIYHEPSGDQGFTPQRGERLLEDDGDGSEVLEWVFFVVELGSDFGLLGWYRKVGDVFEPGGHKVICKCSTMTEKRHWRRAWV